jgi:thiolase-like protein
MNEVYVVSAVRTAIGTFGGSLKDIPPAELASRVTAEAVRRASVAPADIGHVVFGQVVQTEPRDMVCLAGGGGGCRHSGGNTGADSQSPVRLRAAGDCVGSAKHQARRLRCRCRRRRGKHEPGTVPGAVVPVGHQNGQRPDRRRARQRAARSLPSRPDGRDGRERGRAARYYPR